MLNLTIEEPGVYDIVRQKKGRSSVRKVQQVQDKKYCRLLRDIAGKQFGHGRPKTELNTKRSEDNVLSFDLLQTSFKSTRINQMACTAEGIVTLFSSIDNWQKTHPVRLKSLHRCRGALLLSGLRLALSGLSPRSHFLGYP